MMFNIIVTILSVALAAVAAAPTDHKSAVQMMEKELKEMIDLITVAHKTISEANSEIINIGSVRRNSRYETDESYYARKKRADETILELWNQFKKEKKADLLKCKDEIVQDLEGMKDKAVAALSSAQPADVDQHIESSRHEFRTRAKNGIERLLRIRSKIFDKNNLVEYVQLFPLLPTKFGKLMMPAFRSRFPLMCDEVKNEELKKNFDLFADAVTKAVQQIDSKFDECIKSDKSLRSNFDMFLSEANTIQYKIMMDVVLCPLPWPVDNTQFDPQLALCYRQHEIKVREIGNELFPIFNDIADASHSHGLMVALQFTRALTSVKTVNKRRRNGKANWYDVQQLKSEKETIDYLIQKVVDVLKWFSAKAGESNKVFAAKLVDLFVRHFKHNVKDISLLDWLSYLPNEWPDWYQFVEFVIWQTSNDYLLDGYGHSGKPESQIQQIIFNTEFV